MTSADSSTFAEPPPLPGEVRQEPRPTSKFGAWIDRVTFRAAEILNPILIKEGRQALKSRSFSIPFLLVLIACLFWSFMAVGVFEDVYYGAVGWNFFIGYFFILSFPLIVIVPFGAFRSLTAEREDGTYELLSITTLKPAQIVNGKLASAMMQMMVYLSAVAPCIAFTYLLRGIDLFSIGLILFWLVAGSVLLSVVSLMLATLTTARHWQMLITVIVISGLVFLFFLSVTLVAEELAREMAGIEIDSWEFWAAHLEVLSGVVMSGALCYSVAHAQLKFPTDNRSTSVRIVMLLCAVVFVGWMGWGSWTFANDIRGITTPIAIAASFFFPFWMLMGSFLVGEYGDLSRRVKRTLPRTFLGRMFSTWFIPGSGTGYVFAITCGFAGSLFGMLMMFIALQQLPAATGGSFISVSETQQVLIYFSLYLTCYLGVGRLVVLLFRRFMQVGVVASMLLNLMIVALGSLVPWIVELSIFQSNFRGTESLYLQTTNPFFVITEAGSGGIGGGVFMVHVLIIGTAALLIFLANMPSVVKEIRQQRMAVPKRVREEQQKDLPAQVSVPSSPFDD